MKINLRAEIDKALTESFRALVSELENLEKMGASPRWLGPVAHFEAQQSAQTWASEGAKSGKKWPDLLQGQGNFDEYVKWKRRNYPRRKINVWRGDTRDSFTQVSNRDHIARVRAGALEFGSKAKLARQMHEGQNFGWYRPFFLKEATPYTPKSRWVNTDYTYTETRGRGRRQREVTMRMQRFQTFKPRNWFTLWVKEVPERPLARKSDAQARELKLSLARELLLAAAQGKGGAIGRGLAKFAGRIRPNPRA